MAQYSEIKATYRFNSSSKMQDDLETLYYAAMNSRNKPYLIHSVQAGYYGQDLSFIEPGSVLDQLMPAFVRFCSKNEVHAIAQYLNKAVLIEFNLIFELTEEGNGRTSVSITSNMDAGPEPYPVVMQYCDAVVKDAFGSRNLELVSTTTAPTSGGCYVATAVYGSYDCPQVWTLRRFRDYELAESVLGRSFIRIYYAISPKVVELLGNNPYFIRFCRSKLDILVNRCKTKGYSSLPYDDRDW